MIKRDRTLKEACELAKASYEKKLKEDILNDLEDGDKILYQGKEYFVADANYSDKYCWITDSEEDRYNKKASGWSLKKAYIDEIIERGNEVDENVSCDEDINDDDYDELTHLIYAMIKDELADRDKQGKTLSRKELESAFDSAIAHIITDDEVSNLTEDLEDIPSAPEGSNVGVVAIISELTQEEFQASDHYNSAIATLVEEGYNDIADLLTEIRADEESHIGVLHKAKAMLDDQTAVKFDDGEKEAQEIVNNTEVIEQ